MVVPRRMLTRLFSCFLLGRVTRSSFRRHEIPNMAGARKRDSATSQNWISFDAIAGSQVSMKSARIRSNDRSRVHNVREKNKRAMQTISPNNKVFITFLETVFFFFFFNKSLNQIRSTEEEKHRGEERTTSTRQWFNSRFHPFGSNKLDAERSWGTLIILSLGVHVLRWGQTFVCTYVTVTDTISRSLSLLSCNLTDNKHHETTMDRGRSGLSMFDDSNENPAIGSNVLKEIVRFSSTTNFLKGISRNFHEIREKSNYETVVVIAMSLYVGI